MQFRGPYLLLTEPIRIRLDFEWLRVLSLIRSQLSGVCGRGFTYKPYKGTSFFSRRVCFFATQTKKNRIWLIKRGATYILIPAFYRLPLLSQQQRHLKRHFSGFYKAYIFLPCQIGFTPISTDYKSVALIELLDYGGSTGNRTPVSW